MGCASSTPMIATGSEMLKAASHVAADATKSAEDAVQDVAQTLGKGLESAKESVGTAVTGIANDLGNAFKEKTDDAKNILAEKLHLNGNHEATASALNQIKNAKATGEDDNKHNGNEKGKDKDNDEDIDDDDDEENDIAQRLSRAPTPSPLQQQQQHEHHQVDTDSLKTSTPEPEIEQALANLSEDSPPTPKPNISELEHLSAELSEIKAETEVSAGDGNNSENDGNGEQQKSSMAATATAATEEPNELNQRRPSTTEWEKYADLLARNQKFHPNEIALRRRVLGAHSSSNALTNPTTAMMTTLMTSGGGGGGGGGGGISGIVGGVVAGVGGVAMPPNANTIVPTIITATKTATAKNGAKTINHPQYFRDFPRSTTDLKGIGSANNPTARLLDGSESGQSERNYGDSTSSPTHPNNVRMQRKRIPRNFTTVSAKKMHRQLTSLGLGGGGGGVGGGVGIGVGVGGTGAVAAVLDRSMLNGLRNGKLNPSSSFVGRNFDFNPNRSRITSPKHREVSLQVLSPLPLRSVGNRSHSIGSPIKLNAMKKRGRISLIGNTSMGPHTTSPSSSTSRLGLHALDSDILSSPNSAKGSLPMPTTNHSPTHSSRSSNGVVVIKSTASTPVSRTTSKNSLANIQTHLIYDDEVECLAPLDGEKAFLPTPSPSQFHRERSFSHSPKPMKNTSSFLSSPRTSPFGIRKSYAINDGDKENKAVFVADLSSVTENRSLLTPSPYKVRERCAVCFKKYVVQ